MFFADMKNVFCPVLQNVQDTPLCPLSDSSERDSGPGEMAGCVLILTAGCSAAFSLLSLLSNAVHRSYTAGDPH